MTHNGRQTKHGRMQAFFACILCLLVLSSAFCATAEAHHDCRSEDCPVCACTARCRENLRFSADLPALSALSLSPVLLSLSVSEPVPALVQATPVSEKIRLNN